MTKNVEIGRFDGVQTLRFKRPEKKNALTPEMYRVLCDALVEGDQSPEVAAHVFLGCEGDFTTGNDIGNFLEFALSPEEASAGQGSSLKPDVSGDVPVAQVFRFINVLPQVKKPMIAAVDGLAVGIGTTLLFHCDLVYASERASFSTPFLDLGLVPEAASSLLAPSRMGYNRAFELIVLGETFSAVRMQEAGIVNHLLPPEEVEAAAIKAARRLAMKPPEALAIARRMLRPDPDILAERTNLEAKAFMERLKSPEARAAFQAFLKRS